MTHSARLLLGFVTALVLALRVVAQPVVLAAPEPGMIAICAGGQIVYVSLKTGETKTSDKTLLSAECPLTVASSALTAENFQISEWFAKSKTAGPAFAEHVSNHVRSKLSHPVRAPPRLI